MKIIIPFLILLILFSTCLFSQERGFKVIAKTSEGETINLYKECYALVIGVSDYTSGWPDLRNAARDADKTGDLFSSLGFKVTKVTNPTRAELIQALDSFVYGPGQEEENCLVIFFAGHGHTERMTYGDDMGYIVPRDAPSPNQDKVGFMQKAIDMRTLEAYARRIQAKHALFLFDSCFSGAIFDMTRAIKEDIKYKTAKPVRQFITAGEADEPVPDRSIFRSQLNEALQGEADRNEDGYITGTELGEFMQEKVVNYSYGTQHPQYGKIRDPNLDKGDFVFMLKSKPAAGYGYLKIGSYPPAKVEIDGKLYREVPPWLEIKLPEGKHTIKFINKELKIDKTFEVVLLKGERKEVHKILDEQK